MYQDVKPEQGFNPPDYSRFDTPIWPKAHVLSLNPEDSYPYATEQQLEDEPSTLLDQHYPLRASRDNTGRLAGTQGRSDFAHADETHGRGAEQERSSRLDELEKRIEDILAYRYKADKTLGDGKEWPAEERAHVEELIEKVRRNGKGRDDALKQLFDDPSVVLSIREIKQLVPNWKLEYPLVSRALKLVMRRLLT